MSIRNNSAKLAAAATLPLLVAANAQASVPEVDGIPGLSFSSQTSRETWKTVMYVSAALLIIGLAGDEGSLVLLGGAGMLVALVNTNGNMFRPAPTTGLEFGRIGSLSLGFKPFNQSWLSQRTPAFEPTFVVQTSIKF